MRGRWGRRGSRVWDFERNFSVRVRERDEGERKVEGSGACMCVRLHRIRAMRIGLTEAVPSPGGAKDLPRARKLYQLVAELSITNEQLAPVCAGSMHSCKKQQEVYIIFSYIFLSIPTFIPVAGMCSQGKGGPKDASLACYWWEKSTHTTNPRRFDIKLGSFVNLAFSHIDGVGVEKDYIVVSAQFTRMSSPRSGETKTYTVLHRTTGQTIPGGGVGTPTAGPCR